MEDGHQFASVTYIQEIQMHPRLPERSIKVWLLTFSEYMTVRRRSDNKDLLTIPWANIKNANISYTNKRGIGPGLLKSLAWAVGLGFHGPGDPFDAVVIVTFWDEDLQRDFELVFKSGGERNAERVTREIWRHVDFYNSMLGRSGRPR